MQTEMVTLQQAADMVGVHERTIRNWMAAGRLEGFRVGPKLLKFRRADIEKLAEGKLVR